MDNRERVRLLMAHLRATRRAHGLCPRCGLSTVRTGDNCDECNATQRVKRDVMVTHFHERSSQA